MSVVLAASSSCDGFRPVTRPQSPPAAASTSTAPAILHHIGKITAQHEDLPMHATAFLHSASKVAMPLCQAFAWRFEGLMSKGGLMRRG